MSEETKKEGLCQRQVGTIALIVAVIALVSSLVPQIQNFCCSGVQVTVSEAAPGPGAGGPGAGGPGRGPGGPGGMMGGGRGGFGRMAPPSDETKALYAERVKLADEALRSAGTEALPALRCDRDLARLMVMRLELGGRRTMPGLAEAFLKKQAAAANPKATALEKNQAALDYQRALDSFRGDKKAFQGTVEAFSGYPQKELTENDLVNLLEAEAPPAPPMP